jgi:hypothetical protein
MKIRNVLEVREAVEVNPLPERYGLRVESAWREPIR